MMMNNCITLLVDADDTLWDNNIFYEQAIGGFVKLLEDEGFDSGDVESKMRVREMENVKHHGYGSRTLEITLKEVYLEECRENGREVKEAILEAASRAGSLTRDYSINLLSGVTDTLPYLKKKYRMILLTKGVDGEQQGKIARSGIGHFFEEIIVVPEKDEEVYRKIIDDYDLQPDLTWMIGNSPKSDINPAKKTGMRTVLIPYHATWEHEIEQISHTGHETHIIDSFDRLIEVLEKSSEEPLE